MSLEANKAIVRRLWDEVWNNADLAVADEIFAPEYAAHEQATVPGWRATFPDSHHTIEAMIAEDDKVVTHFKVHATHRGEFMGIAPTGRQITMTGIWIHRLVNGQIVEGRTWGVVDFLGLLQQLGAQVTPGQVS